MTSQEIKELKEAATKGDVKWLKNCIASNKPIDFYLTVFQNTGILEGNNRTGNIFHVAALRNHAVFLKEATKSLQSQVLEQLILQQCETSLYNPLHVAAETGNLEIVKMFLNISMSTTHEKPWLIKNNKGNTPCHIALLKGNEDCALEILRMDMDLLCKMEDDDVSGILYKAVYRGLSKFALEILKSPSSFSYNYKGVNGFTPLHYVTNCSEGEEIQMWLLEREPDQVQQISVIGFSILHTWVTAGKVWPFKLLLKSNRIIPNVTRVVYDLMSTTTSNQNTRGNPLHYLAVNNSSEEVVEIAKLLIDTYKQEASAQASSTLSEDHFPWFARDRNGSTPLDLAIAHQNTSFALYIMSTDNNTLFKTKSNPLLFAIYSGYSEIAENVLEIVEEKGWNQLLADQLLLNALHYAPRCKKKFFERLLKNYPSLLEGVDMNGISVLQTWTIVGELWPFEYILQSGKLDAKWRSSFIKQISTYNYTFGDNPFHIAANITNEAGDEIAKLLVEAYKEEISNWNFFSIAWLPWFANNKAHDGPLHLAIRKKRENLALYILSLLHNYKKMEILLDIYQPVHKTLFLAVENNCFQVAKEIVTQLNKSTWKKYLINESDGRSILHLAPSCTDREFVRWLIEEVPLDFITQKNKKGETPLDEASEVGATWIIQAMLEKDTSAFNKSPLAWVKACGKGHISTVRVFIEYYPGKFIDHCIHVQDSPLHHIKLRNVTGYEEFLDIPRMKDLINVQNSQGETPLHKAIRDQNLFLTETLLNIDKIKYDIKDLQQKTAKDLLKELYKSNNEWKQMCKNIGFDPTIRTTYFQHKEKLLDVRNTLALVAALLATITFTAGFTLPGGLDNNGTGKAVLAKKTAFKVFIISDTVAMCSSMLTLIFLVWSMVYDPNKSLVFINYSMWLLLISIYTTLLAFMTGVYVVISPSVLWAAILIVVLCGVIGLFAHIGWVSKIKNILLCCCHNLGDRTRQLEEGNSQSEHDRLLRTRRELTRS